MIKISIPTDVNRILSVLRKAGHEAYVVGGCVRDALLDRTPSDWDVTTSADPAAVTALFPKTLATGIQHGTVTVILHGRGYEVTTYRIDGAYEDARHPKEVTFTASLEEDLRRRDFTINALAYSEEDGLVDLFGGQKDLADKVVRCVGEPKERFTEDALRIMRAFRFAAQLGFTVEEKTREAAGELSERLSMISAERIREELVKLITSDHPERMIDLYEAGATKVFLPEFDLCMETPQTNPYHCYDVGRHIVASMCAIRNDPLLRITMLLHDIAKPATRTVEENGTDHFFRHPEESAVMGRTILKRLKFDNRTIRRATALIRYHDMHLGKKPTHASMRRMMHILGREDFPLLIEVVAADNAAKSPAMQEKKKEELTHIQTLYEDILAAGDAVELKDLVIDGGDLISLGIGEGREVGRILDLLMEDVLDTPAHNEKTYLLAKGKELHEKEMA